jgi:hypothetical protein
MGRLCHRATGYPTQACNPYRRGLKHQPAGLSCMALPLIAGRSPTQSGVSAPWLDYPDVRLRFRWLASGRADGLNTLPSKRITRRQLKLAGGRHKCCAAHGKTGGPNSCNWVGMRVSRKGGQVWGSKRFRSYRQASLVLRRCGGQCRTVAGFAQIFLRSVGLSAQHATRLPDQLQVEVTR